MNISNSEVMTKKISYAFRPLKVIYNCYPYILTIIKAFLAQLSTDIFRSTLAILNVINRSTMVEFGSECVNVIIQFYGIK
jgi:hypothetical protein